MFCLKYFGHFNNDKNILRMLNLVYVGFEIRSLFSRNIIHRWHWNM